MAPSVLRLPESLLLGDACVELLQKAKATFELSFANLGESWKGAAWLALPPNAVLHLLASDKLSASSENTVFVAFKRWLSNSGISPAEHRSTAFEA